MTNEQIENMDRMLLENLSVMIDASKKCLSILKGTTTTMKFEGLVPIFVNGAPVVITTQGYGDDELTKGMDSIFGMLVRCRNHIEVKKEHFSATGSQEYGGLIRENEYLTSELRDRDMEIDRYTTEIAELRGKIEDMEELAEEQGLEGLAPSYKGGVYSRVFDSHVDLLDESMLALLLLAENVKRDERHVILDSDDIINGINRMEAKYNDLIAECKKEWEKPNGIRCISRAYCVYALS